MENYSNVGCPYPQSTSFYSQEENQNTTSFSTKYTSLSRELKKYTFKHDLEARLVCRQSSNGHWDTVLTNITGEKIQFLLGRIFGATEELPLEALFVSSKQKSHEHKVDTVLNQGSESKYWSPFFENMIGRVVPIINPTLGVPRFVKMFMEEGERFSSDKKVLEFKVIMIDQTADHVITDQVGSFSHDVEGLLRTGIRELDDARQHFEIDNKDSASVKDSLELCAEYEKKLKSLEEVHGRVKEIFECCMLRCYQSKKIAAIENLKIDAGLMQDLVSVQDRLNTFILEFSSKISAKNLQNITIDRIGETTCLIKKDTTDVFLRFLENILQNAIDANSTIISIETLEHEGFFLLLSER